MVKALAEQVKQSGDPVLALELLSTTIVRSHVEDALAVLKRSVLDDNARPTVRERYAFYAEHSDKDRGATQRENFVRLLVEIGHPDDLDIYLRAVNLYEGAPPMPQIDIAQKVRAAALVGIAAIDSDVAALYAVKLLGEVKDTSDFSGEPALTALNLLIRYERWLPIYQYALLVDGYKAEYAEVVSRALESFPADFPVALYVGMARRFISRDQAVEQTGIIGYVVDQRRADLYPLLEQVITTTKNSDLHRYTVIQLAAARDPALNALLFTLAKRCSLEHVPHFIEALELTPGSDEVLKLLRTRKR